MDVDKRLQLSIEKMKTGDKKAFLVFYNKTFQLCCIRAARIIGDPIRRDDFLAEFYPYVLLHINEMEDDQELFPWLESAIPVFYELWSGESVYLASRPLHPDIPDEDHIRMSARAVWERINNSVIFPAEAVKKKLPLPLLVIGFLAILTIALCLLLIQVRKGNYATDNSEIDRINQENLDFATDISGSDPDIEGLYTETTTEVIIEGERRTENEHE